MNSKNYPDPHTYIKYTHIPFYNDLMNKSCTGNNYNSNTTTSNATFTDNSIQTNINVHWSAIKARHLIRKLFANDNICCKRRRT